MRLCTACHCRLKSISLPAIINFIRDMKKYFIFVAFAIFLFSCGRTADSGGVLSVDELSSVIEEMESGDTLSVRGFCVDVCSSGANHITLVGEDSTKAIMAVADGKLTSFKDEYKYQYVTVTGVLNEQRVDSTFLADWEYRLDESLKAPDGGNPEAVAQLKEQIYWLRDSIAARYARSGKNYWSNYTIEAFDCSADEE